MWYFLRNKILVLTILIFSNTMLISQAGILHGMVDSITQLNATFSSFNCDPGLSYKVWNQTGLTSCNAFFGGSPGVAPVGFADSNGCSNTQYADFSISPGWNGTDDIVQFRGFIIIPETGNYRFRTFSDDGSRLYVNNNLVVDNDGLHAPRTRTSGNIFLAAGIYPYECQFFERGQQDILVVSWETPSSTNFDIIPNDFFFRSSNPECTNMWLNPSKPRVIYSCPKEIQDLDLPSGVYLFDPDGDGLNIFRGYYDNSLGGGWLMILNYVHAGGTNPALNIRNNDLPILLSSSLGNDESGTIYWGHASNSLLNQFNITEVRFFGVTDNHQRVLHFSTNRNNVINYIQSGTGNMSGIQNGFTNYAGSGTGTADLPDVANTFRSNQGDLALTREPFYRNGDRRWDIGNGDDWEMDNNVGNENSNTIHRAWIRTTDCSVSNQLPPDGNDLPIWESVTKFTRESILSNMATNVPSFINNATENINFNPVMRFDNDLLSAESVIGVQNGELTAFIVTKETTRQQNTLLRFKSSGSGFDRYYTHAPWTDGNVYWDIGSNMGNNRISGPFPNPINQVSTITITNSNNNNRQDIIVDGLSIANDASGNLVLNLDTTSIGNGYNGYIGDVIVIDRLLPAQQIERIESYLALKYGVTLAHNYYNSDDELVFDIGNGYANDIFGLARDQAHCLYQKKSHTENLITSDIVFELTNDIADKQFLVSGHNGNALTKRTLAAVPNTLQREWFAQMTGNVGTVNVEVDLASINSSIGATPADVKIIIADNPAFTNAYVQEAASVIGGVALFEGVVLYDKYYTFSAP